MCVVRRLMLLVPIAGSIALTTPLAAQEPVGGAVPLPTRAIRLDTLADSLKGPPLTPGRAFFTSLLLPGFAQSRLGRPTASILFAAAEVISIGMARKSAQDVREAERAPKDSVIAGYTIDPTTLVATPTGYIASRFTPSRIRARHLHYEDWIAAIIFTHIIAATDAYVAAHLWDFKTTVALSPQTRATRVSASVAF